MDESVGSRTVIDVSRLRADTPGTDNVVHLNNAGAALMPLPVVDAVQSYFDDEIAFGGYETHRKRRNEIDAVYESLAGLLGAERSEIALADNATRAWDVLFYSMGFLEGDRILTSSTEYVSNWAAYLNVQERHGVTVDVVPAASTGEIDVEALDRMASDGRTALITMNHMPTNSGLVNPAADVGAVASEHGIPYLLDACQTMGQMPVDVSEIRCDMLTGTSRKFLRGPRGVGFLYVAGDFIDRLNPVFVELASAPVVLPDRYELASGASRFETWEKAYANVVGLGRAVEYAVDIGIEPTWERIQTLADSMRTQLQNIEGVRVRDEGSVQGAIVTFEVEDRQVVEVRELLSERSINVDTITTFSSPVDMHTREISGLVRASVHAYNTEDEIAQLAEALTVLA